MFAFSDGHSILSLLIWSDIIFLNPAWTPLHGVSRKSYHFNIAFFPGLVKLLNTSPSECSSTCFKGAIRHIGTQVSKETVTHGHFPADLFSFLLILDLQQPRLCCKPHLKDLRRHLYFFAQLCFKSSLQTMKGGAVQTPCWGKPCDLHSRCRWTGLTILRKHSHEGTKYTENTFLIVIKYFEVAVANNSVQCLSNNGMSISHKQLHYERWKGKLLYFTFPEVLSSALANY